MGYGPTHPHRLLMGLWSHHNLQIHLADLADGSYETPEIANRPFIKQQTVQQRKRGDSKGHPIKPTGCDNYIISINLETIYILHPDKSKWPNLNIV